jgi:H+-transporting ATPase
LHCSLLSSFLLCSDFLTLFSARTGELWLWQSKPAGILVGAASLALSASTILACAWPDSKPDGIQTLGLARRAPRHMAAFVWIYCIFWWFVQDAIKVGVFTMLKKYNLFSYNDTGRVVLPQSTIDYIANNKASDSKSMSAKAH